VHDVNILDEIAPEAGAFYVMLIFDTRLAEVGHRQRVTILKIA
jgi:hypothetical protein